MSTPNSKVSLQFSNDRTIFISNAICSGDENDIRVGLHAACHYKAKEMVYFLLEKGANPNVIGWYLVCFSELPPL